MDSIKRTESVYGFLWVRSKETSPPDKWHFNIMQEVIDVPIVRGRRGIDIGSGCGYDTYIMAKDNPCVEIVSIDISDGVYRTKELTSSLSNVSIVKCSALDIPAKDNVFDFAYSFGVLHHLVNPGKALSEIYRILKVNSPVFLYLYEDHSENLIKYIAVRMVALLRNITAKVPPKVFYAICWALSPLVFIIFSVPSKVLRRFKATQDIASKMPFNFGGGPFSLRGDLYDRLNAPVERRFNRQEVGDLLSRYGFSDITITKLNDKAGWVAWGYKC